PDSSRSRTPAHSSPRTTRYPRSRACRRRGRGSTARPRSPRRGRRSGSPVPAWATRPRAARGPRRSAPPRSAPRWWAPPSSGRRSGPPHHRRTPTTPRQRTPPPPPVPAPTVPRPCCPLVDVPRRYPRLRERTTGAVDNSTARALAVRPRHRVRTLPPTSHLPRCELGAQVRTRREGANSASRSVPVAEARCGDRQEREVEQAGGLLVGVDAARGAQGRRRHAAEQHRAQLGDAEPDHRTRGGAVVDLLDRRRTGVVDLEPPGALGEAERVGDDEGRRPRDPEPPGAQAALDVEDAQPVVVALGDGDGALVGDHPAQRLAARAQPG